MMRVSRPRSPSGATVLRWATITLALLAGLVEWLALLRARWRRPLVDLRQG